MKNYLLMVLSLAIFAHTSCTKNDSTIHVNQLASFKSEISNEAIAGAVVHVDIAIKKVSGSYVYNQLTDSFTTKTDDNGNLHLNVSASDDPNAFITFYKASDAYSTGLLTFNNSFLISDFIKHPVTFYVRKYVPLLITLKHTSPANSDDGVSVSFIQNGTNYIEEKIDSIKNYGISNLPLAYPAFDDGLNPYWKGINVDSKIYGKLQEGTSWQVSWNVIKQGVSTTYNSPTFETSSTRQNKYDILY